MNPIFWRSLLALLPILGWVSEPARGFISGWLGLAVLLSATLIFLKVRPRIPQTFRFLVFFLILLALFTMAREFFPGRTVWKPVPVLLVSLCILADPDLFRIRTRPHWVARKTLLAGLWFWLLLTGHGLLVDGFGRKVGMEIFKLPAEIGRAHV